MQRKPFGAESSMSSRVASSAFHIPSLDGIRACAFLLVFLGHAGVPGIPAGFGVTVFFFLSGYLITTLLRLEVERSGRIDSVEPEPDFAHQVAAVCATSAIRPSPLP